MGSYDPRKKRLIVTADDFGLTAGVNRGIVRAHREGIITSASLMVTGSAFEQAVELARDNPRLDLGLHFNLTIGNPFSLASAMLRGRIRSSDVEREFRSQVERAQEAGVQISHIDGHKHVHALPRVLKVICKVAPEYGIRAIRAIRERVPGLLSLLARNTGNRGSILKQYCSGRVATAVWAAASRSGAIRALISPVRFYGMSQTGFLDITAFARIVPDIPVGISELMCHPGYCDEALLNTPTRLLQQRERELELMLNPETRELLRAAGIELVSYKDLVESDENCGTASILDRCSAI